MNSSILNYEDYNLKILRDDYLVLATVNGVPSWGHYVYTAHFKILGYGVEYKTKARNDK